MNRHDLHKVQQMGGYPSLTITMPTHRTSPDNRQDPIRLKNLVGQATDRLVGEFGSREVGSILWRLENLSANIDYRNTLDGLALFVNRDAAAKFYLPFDLPERVVVDNSFLVRDLVFAMNRTPRYWVLMLSEKPARLYEGAKDTLIEVQEEGFPMLHSGPGGETNLPGGKGVNRSAHRDERHRQFFRAVDQAFKPFMVDDPLPLVIVGVDRYQSFFKEVSEHADAILGAVTGSHAKTSAPRLAKLVWPLVKEALAEQRQQYLAELEKAIGERTFGSTIAQVWRLANEGRGSLLLVEEDYHYPAVVDESGNLFPAEDPAAPQVIADAVDNIIEEVISKGGRVVFTPNGALEAHQRIALVTRW